MTYCSKCGEELSRETKTIEKLAHTPGEAVEENRVDSTCKVAGSYDEVIYCIVCGEELSRTEKSINELKPHTFGEWNVSKQPTETEVGEKSRTCSVCGHTETVEIPVLGHTHVYTEVSYDWSEYYDVAEVTVKCCDAVGGSVSEEVDVTVVNSGSKLTFSIEGELKGVSYEDTKVVEIVNNGDGTFALKLPESKNNLMVIIEGYNSDNQTVESLVLGEDEPVDAETIFSIAGSTIKVFFVDTENYMPVMQNLTFIRERKAEIIDNGDGTYTLVLPEELEDTLVIIAGYKSSGKMTSSLVLGGVNKTVAEETVFKMTGKTVKAFFLDAKTYIPVDDPLTK